MAATRPRSLAGVAGSLCLLTVLVCLGALFIRPTLTGALWGLFSYALYRTLIARRLLCRHHHRGVNCYRLERFEEAHQAFVQSEQFFRRYPFLDRWRSVILGSASAYNFVELAGYNQALCMNLLGQDQEALRRLDQLLHERPTMAAAIALRGTLSTPFATDNIQADPDRWFA